jgi:hypothetical protein
MAGFGAPLSGRFCAPHDTKPAEFMNGPAHHVVKTIPNDRRREQTKIALPFAGMNP